MFDIVVDKISKSYNGTQTPALKELSFKVNKGELFGIIGPDGAGKTSLFRILTTLILPDAGEAIVNGSHIIEDYKDIRSKVGYMPGKFSLYQDLSVEENLNFFATIFNTSIAENYSLIEDIYELLKPFKNRKAGKLSGGMKQKLALCCALIHRPKILFLDEPTTGVDTVSRKEFWRMLKRLKHEGITILVSTPYMDEAIQCERIALLQGGEIMSIDTPQQIMEKYPHKLFAIRSDNMSKLLKDLRMQKQVRSVYAFGEYHHVSFIKNTQEEIPLLLQALDHSNLEIKPINANIEDCFIELMTTNATHE